MFIDIRTVDHPDDPKYPGVIRMFHFLQGESYHDKDDPTILHYRETSYADMKGYVPTSLLNMVVASQSSKEYKNMY
jgi:hypothetical protein